MNRTAYLCDKDVQSFIDWLSKQLLTLPINLDISSSKFVRGGLKVSITGLTNVIPIHYKWCATGAPSGTWAQTTVRLGRLSKLLRKSVAMGNNDLTLRICCKILKWGGDRNSAKGATPFLKDLGGGLCKYIQNTGTDFYLSTTSLSAPSSTVKMMNSMLTKIHALYSIDGLPIYDSRVAAAIATLVEMWRHTTKPHMPLPPILLNFPGTLQTRSVKQKFPKAISPGTFSYDKRLRVTTAQNWADAKIRLGWLMSEVLSKNPSAFISSGPSLAARMRAMEASLFMIGYDVTCL